MEQKKLENKLEELYEKRRLPIGYKARAKINFEIMYLQEQYYSQNKCYYPDRNILRESNS